MRRSFWVAGVLALCIGAFSTGFAVPVGAATALEIAKSPALVSQVIVGKPPSPSFEQWLATLPRRSESGRVCWTGVLGFVDRDFPAAIVSTIDPLPGAPCGVIITRITLASYLSDSDARYFTRAELARFDVLDWLISNQSYLSWDDPEFVSLSDGLGYLRVVATERAGAYQLTHPLVSWDAESEPSCNQLLAIQDLHDIEFVAGPGVEKLLDREGCW